MPEHPADRHSPPCRRRVEGRGSSHAGRGTALRFVGPFRSSVLLADFEADLAAGLLALLAREPGVTGIVEQPEAFEWIDGVDGRDHLHLPLALVCRGDGNAAFVDAMPRATLRRDPELGGRRRRIEIECLARGASYEVWTEDEILQDRSVAQVLRVTTTAERADYARASRSAAAPAVAILPVLSTMAGRLHIDDLHAVGTTWIGRSRLTGIPMALLGDMELDPETRVLAWRPRPAAAEPRPGTVGSAGAASPHAIGREMAP